ncbi:MAG: hypothetical protein KJ752_02915, partial [Alphaproteobacteria bacterium]|nr:hypothetical protein [Alphaproteobacteria bacterium]MBU0875977.1 hypothetical protein [Alphaproteobacteria bacterium]
MSTDPLLPGVPLIESPLFAHHLATHGWSDAEREVATALNEKGYAVDPMQVGFGYAVEPSTFAENVPWRTSHRIIAFRPLSLSAS